MQQNCVTDVEHQSPRLCHSVTSSSSQYKGFLQSVCVCVCVCVCASVHVSACAQLCLTLTQWTVACQVPMSMEFSRQEYWSWLLFSSPEYLCDPGIKPTSLESLVLAGGILYQHTKR